ncbi:ABC transporter ATP-binding protein [Dongia sp. agr-C8]
MVEHPTNPSEDIPAESASALISVKDLAKHFREVAAVDGIDFEVRRGETVALLGGNGAGKTTTISMLLGLLKPTRGVIQLFGLDLARHRHRVLGRMNFSSPYVDLPHRLTLRHNLMVFAKLYGLKDAKRRIAELAKALELESLLDRRVGSLSAGQKTRGALAKALINRPELLLLDEPTASLDPDTADWVRHYLERYQQETRCAILLASHNMGEVERLADRVLMLRQGKIVDAGSPDDLLFRYSRQNLEEVFLDIARERRAGGAPASEGQSHAEERA